jgi:hypothetical protein
MLGFAALSPTYETSCDSKIRFVSFALSPTLSRKRERELKVEV